MAYVATSDLRTYLNVNTPVDDTLLGLCITRAQQSIETYCDRWFEARTQTRLYTRPYPYPILGRQYEDPVEYRRLYLDEDLLSITTLLNGDATSTPIPTSGVFLEPLNRPPFSRILLKTAYVWTWDTDQVVSVAGSWGFSTTAPADIQHANLRLAAYLYRQRDASVFGTIDTPDGARMTLPSGLPGDVKAILDPYKKVWGARG